MRGTGEFESRNPYDYGENSFSISFQNFTLYDFQYWRYGGSRQTPGDPFFDEYEVGDTVSPWVVVSLGNDCYGKAKYLFRDRQFLADQVNLEAGKPLLRGSAIGDGRWVAQLMFMRRSLRDTILQHNVDWRFAPLEIKQKLMRELVPKLSIYEPDVAWFGRYLLNSQPASLMNEGEPEFGVIVSRAIAEVLPRHIEMQEALIDHAFARMTKELNPPALVIDNILAMRSIYDIDKLKILPKDAL